MITHLPCGVEMKLNVPWPGISPDVIVIGREGVVQACSKGVVQLGRLLPSSVSTPCRSHQQVEKGPRHCICVAIIAIHNLGISAKNKDKVFRSDAASFGWS